MLRFLIGKAGAGKTAALMEEIRQRTAAKQPGAILLVPEKAEPGTAYASDSNSEQKEVVSVDDIEDLNPAQLKSRTIRIDALMFDEEVDPNPPDEKFAAAMKSRTMRIDLPDEF